MEITHEEDGEAELGDNEDDFLSGDVTGRSNANKSRPTGKASSSPRGVTAMS